MGTWGKGLFDGDGPLDAVGDITDWIESQVVDPASTPSSPEAVARLGAATGLLLELSPYSFESDEVWEQLRPTFDAHAGSFGSLGGRATEVLDHIARGDGKALGDCKGERSDELQHILGGYLNGVREAALFEHPSAGAFVQEVADHIAASVDDGVGGDFSRYEADFMGPVGLLLLIAPYRLDPARVAQWRGAVNASYERAVAEEDEGLGFFEAWLERANAAFDAVIERCRG